MTNASNWPHGRGPRSTTNRRSFPGGDTIAGASSALVLGVAVVVGIRVWLAIPLAVAVYAGLVLLRPASPRRPSPPGSDADREQIAYQTAIANARAIRALQPRIANPGARERVGRISERIERILAVMREDRALAAAPLFNERLLNPFVSLLTEYVRLSSRGVTSAHGLLEKVETGDLPMIEQAVEAFYEQLHRASLLDLATLSEILAFGLDGIRATVSRRTKP